MRVKRFIRFKSAGVLWGWAMLILVTCASRLSAQPQGAIQTVAGAFAGFVDNAFGNAEFGAQFDGPMGLAIVAKDKKLLVADANNNRIRAIRTTDQFVSTFLPVLNQVSRLQRPIAVASDIGGNVYVANEISHDVQKYDHFGNYVQRVAQTPSVPTALAVGQGTNLYVAELNGVVTKYNGLGDVVGVYRLTNATAQFRGIALLAEGKVAVSDSGNHVIWVFNRPGDEPLQVAGILGVSGFANGGPAYGLLNQPWGLAAGPNNSVVIADRGNHRVRVLGCDGTLDTLYGIDPTEWLYIPGADNIYPGWYDSNPQYAESRDPVGVAVDGSTVYGTEDYYHLIRSATGLAFPDACGTGVGTTNGTGTNVVLRAPGLLPNSGYYPMGVTVIVTNPASTTGFGDTVTLYYTTDGTDPSTNSPIAAKNASGFGVIPWRSALRDLTSLRVRSLDSGTVVLSPVGRGVPVTFADAAIQGEVGIPPNLGGTNLYAGLGSSFIVPVVANLRGGVELRSLQMVVEVSPADANTARLEPPVQPKVLTMSGNDFVPMAVSSTNAPLTIPFSVGGTNRLGVVYIGTNVVFKVSPFGTVAVLSIPIPSATDSLGHASRIGSKYRVHITQASGTSDGQKDVPLQIMEDRFITVTNIGYLVGDTTPAAWYNAGDFGDPDPGLINNSDVNNVFYASLGFKVPYAGSDAFNAMDVVPEDSATRVGGDGEIRFLDWQVLLRRSLGFNTGFWRRTWTLSGLRRPYMGTAQPADASGVVTAKAAPAGYHRQVRISADGVSSVFHNNITEIPVRLRIKPGAAVAGFQFVARVTSDQGQPPVSAVGFTPDPRMAPPSLIGNSIPGLGTLNDAVFCSWNVGAIPVPLEGSVLVGRVIFRVPVDAGSGRRYTVHFEKADGAADDLTTMYDFESLPGDVWVESLPLLPAETLPDEWKIYHFGDLISELAQAPADPDRDGFTNYEEYLAQTDPVSPDWRVSISETGARIRWFGKAGVTYSVERSHDLHAWEPVGPDYPGNDQMLMLSDPSANQGNQYYRFRTH